MSEPVQTDPGTGQTGPEADFALFDELRLLADDARTYAEAELAFQKSRAGVAAGGIKSVAILGVAAFLFVFFALGALTIGALLALAEQVGAWGATGIVCGTLLIATAACLLLARRRWRATMARIAGGKGAA